MTAHEVAVHAIRLLVVHYDDRVCFGESLDVLWQLTVCVRVLVLKTLFKYLEPNDVLLIIKVNIFCFKRDGSRADYQVSK